MNIVADDQKGSVGDELDVALEERQNVNGIEDQAIEDEFAQKSSVGNGPEVQSVAEEGRVRVSEERPVTNNHLVHHVHVRPRISA